MIPNATTSEPNLRLSTRVLAPLCTALALFASGCQQPTKCAELGDCGGAVPVGDWALGPGHVSCSEDLYEQPVDKRLEGLGVPAQRLPAPEQAFTDWCSGLITSTEKVQKTQPSFFTESAPYGAAVMHYEPDGTYALGLVRTGTFYFEFSEACMRGFGATEPKPAPNVDGTNNPTGTPVGICKQLEVPLRAAGDGEGAYRNVTCDVNPNEPKGCLCYFDASEVSGQAGTYHVVGNEILHIPNPPGFAVTATFCNSGTSLQLTGANGAYLFGRPGLRTLDFGFVNCADGVQGFGEEGVDCGASCNIVCP
jgi:hypothetical protein